MVKQSIPDIPLYNSRILDNYIKLIKKRYDDVNIQELLDSAGITSYQIADEGHWFTQKQINHFHDKLSQLTSNENIAREAGRLAASPESIGAMRQYVLGMVSPAQGYTLLGKAAEKFTKSTNYKIQKLSTNKVEIKVTPREGVKEQPFQCENRFGFFEAMTMIFTSKLPQIEHPECVFRGGGLLSLHCFRGKEIFRCREKSTKLCIFIFFSNMHNNHFYPPCGDAFCYSTVIGSDYISVEFHQRTHRKKRAEIKP
jgi:hypothetical protein